MSAATLPTRKGLSVQPLQRKALGDDVYAVLRKMIVHRQLQPGSKIVEGQIASLLGVSRTPVREALQRLEYDGWVQTRLGHSPRVAPMTISKIQEIYPLIAVLEGLAVRLATLHLTPADLRQMEELTDTMEACARRGEVEKLLEADNQFHGLLHERSQNRSLRGFVSELRAKTERLEHVFFSSAESVHGSLRRHRKLVRLLRGGDAAAAQKAVESQWELGRVELLEIVRKKKMAVEDYPSREAPQIPSPRAGVPGPLRSAGRKKAQRGE